VNRTIDANVIPVLLTASARSLRALPPPLRAISTESQKLDETRVGPDSCRLDDRCCVEWSADVEAGMFQT